MNKEHSLPDVRLIGKVKLDQVVVPIRRDVLQVASSDGRTIETELPDAKTEICRPWSGRGPIDHGEGVQMSTLVPDARPFIGPTARFLPVALDDVRLPSNPSWLIRGILPARGLTCIVGPPKSGKSFLTTDMLCAVARGVPTPAAKLQPAPSCT
jgi:AAA domain